MRFIFSLALGLIMLLCSSAAFSGGSGDIPVIRVNDSNIQLDISGSIQVNRTSPKAQWPWEVSGAWDSYSVEPVKWVGNDSSRVRWFRFRVENRSGDSASMVLSVSNIFIKKVDVFVQNQRGQLVSVWHTGIDRGLSSKFFPSSGWDFPIFSRNHEYSTVYVRLTSDLDTQFRFGLVDAKRFNFYDTVDKVINGIIAGIMLIVFISSLVFFIFLREKRYLYYTVLAFAVTACIWISGSYLTILSRFFSSHADLVRDYVTAGLLALAGFSGSVFTILPSCRAAFFRYAQIFFTALGLFGATLVWFVPEKAGFLFMLFSYALMMLLGGYFIIRAFREQNYIHLGYVFVAEMFLLGVNVPNLALLGYLGFEAETHTYFCLVSGLLGIMVSISMGYRAYYEKTRGEQAFLLAEENSNRLSQFLKHSSSGLFLMSWTGDIEDVNPAFVSLAGNLKAGADGSQDRRFSSICREPEVFNDFFAGMIRKVNARLAEEDDSLPSVSDVCNLVITGREGNPVPVKLSLTFMPTNELRKRLKSRSIVSNSMYLFIGELYDMSQDESYVNRLRYLESHDTVTGVYNRRYFMEILNQALEQEGTNKGVLCVMRIQNLNYINDVAGHVYGDQILTKIAECLKSGIRKEFDVFRLNGNEFAVLMRGCSAREAIVHAKNWRRDLISLHLNVAGNMHVVTMNMGLVLIDTARGSVSALLSCADAACRSAMDMGPNTYHLFISDKTINRLPDYTETVSLVTRIHQALDSGSIFAVRQKILNMSDRSRKCYELFARIIGDRRDVIEPAAFVTRCYGFNIMSRIDSWMLESLNRICRDNPERLRDIDVLFVNISSETICDEDFITRLQDLLNSNLALTRVICFEIDEDDVSRHLDSALNFMNRFRNRCLGFALDNFGKSGCLGYMLKLLPVSYIKFHPDFTQSISRDESNLIIIKALIQMARGLHMHTMVSQIETEEDFRIFEELGVDFCQGCYICPPCPVSQEGPGSAALNDVPEECQEELQEGKAVRKA